MKRMSGPPKTWAAAAALVLLGAGVLAYVYAISASAQPRPAPLITFSADAYSVEAAALLGSFSASSGIPVAPATSGGSFADANRIAAGAPDDVFLSASLSATGPAYLGTLSPGWAIGFASDQMVIAYENGTSAAPVVALGRVAERSNSTSDWGSFFRALTSGSVRLGISDPDADPAGVRGWLALEAAGFIYGGGNESAYSSSLMEAGANVTGAHAAALVPSLQSGRIQFLFIYRSAAVADGLPFLSLDRHVNLGDPRLGAFYSRFTYKDSSGTQSASPIVICVTVPLGSANQASALEFVRYVVANSASLSEYGLEPLSPARLYNNTMPPAPVLQLVSQGTATYAGALQ